MLTSLGLGFWTSEALAQQPWGIRPNIEDLQLSPTEYDQLRTALYHHIDQEVMQEHCNYGAIYMIESDWSFLPFHRVYLEGLEDYLYSLGPPWRNWVPLPRWRPTTPLPLELRFNDADCGTANCFVFGGDPWQCGWPQDWDPVVAKPPYLSLPSLPGPGNDLCDWSMDPISPPTANPDCCPNGLSRQIEYPHHDEVHELVGNGWPGGVMRIPRAPAALGFWFFHAYIDDIWKDWEMNCPQSTMAPIDLYMKDMPITWLDQRDRGEEPNIDQGPMWISEDIWVRRQDDGVFFQEHENPDHFTTPGLTNYVYVRVRNRGSMPSTGSEQLTLHWAKAATALSWPTHWDGSIQLMGGQVEQAHTLPIIQPGGSHIEVFQWNPPDPQLYADEYSSGNALLLADEPWHFCLLARIETAPGPDYGMTYPETESVNLNTKNNNNIVWKNISVINIDGMTGGDPWPDERVVGATVLVGDASGNGGVFDLVFKDPDHFTGNPVTGEAEVRITLQDELWNAWQNAGGQMENLQISREDRYQLILTGGPARLIGIPVPADTRYLAHIGFNFLSAKLTGQKAFDFDFIQQQNGETVGGERYHLSVPSRPGFYANAGGNRNVSPNTTVELNANSIAEAAIYNWYDPSGTLISTGTELSVSPDVTTKYKLEVIAELDGVKDYDFVEVKIKEHEIISVVPNPTTGATTVSYHLGNASSAYLILSASGWSGSNQYILDVSQGVVQLNVENLPPGAYNLVLAVNGQPVDVCTITVL